MLGGVGHQHRSCTSGWAAMHALHSLPDSPKEPGRRRSYAERTEHRPPRSRQACQNSSRDDDACEEGDIRAAAQTERSVLTSAAAREIPQHPASYGRRRLLNHPHRPWSAEYK